MSFLYFVLALAAWQLRGAFGSLFAGFTDRFRARQPGGRRLLLTGVLTLVVIPRVHTGLGWAIGSLAVSLRGGRHPGRHAGADQGLLAAGRPGHGDGVLDDGAGAGQASW